MSAAYVVRRVLLFFVVVWAATSLGGLLAWPRRVLDPAGIMNPGVLVDI